MDEDMTPEEAVMVRAAQKVDRLDETGRQLIRETTDDLFTQAQMVDRLIADEEGN